MTPCSLLNRYQRFGGTCCLYIQSRRLTDSSTLKIVAAGASETLVTNARLYGDIQTTSHQSFYWLRHAGS